MNNRETLEAARAKIQTLQDQQDVLFNSVVEALVDQDKGEAEIGRQEDLIFEYLYNDNKSVLDQL